MDGSDRSRWRGLRYALPWQAARYVTAQFKRLSDRIGALEQRADGTAAVYLGNNRLLVRSIVGGHTLAYCVQADDRLLTPWFAATGHYEVPVTDYLRRQLRPDSHCIDVGANFGYYTCLMARLSGQGRVIGVEPEPGHFELLRDNIFVNNLQGSAQARHAAVAEREGRLVLHRRVTRAGNTSAALPDPGFVAAMGEEPPVAFEVACVTLDGLAQELGGRVDFVKVDVEGLEAAVLRGAAGMVAANPQINIVMEWSPGQMTGVGSSDREALDAIRSLGLTIRDIVDDPGAMLGDAELYDGRFRTAILLSGPAATFR